MVFPAFIHPDPGLLAGSKSSIAGVSMPICSDIDGIVTFVDGSSPSPRLI